jgi:hypothetical protein
MLLLVQGFTQNVATFSHTFLMIEIKYCNTVAYTSKSYCAQRAYVVKIGWAKLPTKWTEGAHNKLILP